MNTDPKSPRVLKVSRVVCVAVAMIVGLMGLAGCGKPSQEGGEAAVNKMQIKRIIKGIVVKDFHNYVFSNDTNSVYIAGKDTVSVRSISKYDNAGNITEFSIHKPEGPLEYSIEELMADTAMFEYTGGKSVKDWVFIEGDNKITDKIDTLEVETVENNFGRMIHVSRKGNRITVFE